MQRQALAWRRDGVRVGLVPTMGCLHAGHMSLVRRARQAVGPRGVVVVSIYVNPTQFAPHEDFRRYPRDAARDCRACREGGVDVVFRPSDPAMYAGGRARGHSTYVAEERLSRTMEGASRPMHFRGVTTVVAKLFNLVLPELAVFGAKDFQQAAIVRRMTRDLNFPVKVVVVPTVREPDGLALSSRNAYLEPAMRTRARALWQAIAKARAGVRARPAPGAAALKRHLTRFIERQPGARVDYLEFFDPATLEPRRRVRAGTRFALAVFLGRTRLIDNARL